MFRTLRTLAAAKPSLCGQPLPHSHPHLLQSGDLTPGIPADDYERRRRALMDALPDNSMVVSVAAPIKYMSGSVYLSYFPPSFLLTSEQIYCEILSPA
jgi:intermediate cleaving peptidase 55